MTLVPRGLVDWNPKWHQNRHGVDLLVRNTRIT